MGPIRTAVKYSLIPLRTLVQIGESFVSSDEEQAPQAKQAAPRRRAAPKRSTSTARKSRPSRRASQKPKDLDDVGLARKVETIIFRDHNVPKGKIDVNAADGVVWLRGEAKTPDMIKTLETQTAGIPEVKKVENLLHLPHTPARRPKAGEGSDPRKVHPRETQEGRTAVGEDSPVEAAHEHEGRQPAPFGSHGDDGS
jgi:hypothetical protein